MTIDNKIMEVLTLFKNEIEQHIPFTKSELSNLLKPTMMGKSGICYILETANDKSIAIYYWSSGIFEIVTDMISTVDDYIFANYSPNNSSDAFYPEDSVDLFIIKMNELKKELIHGAGNAIK